MLARTLIFAAFVALAASAALPSESILDRIHEALENVHKDAEKVRHEIHEKVESFVKDLAGKIEKDVALGEAEAKKLIADLRKFKPTGFAELIEKVRNAIRPTQTLALLDGGILEHIHEIGERIRGDIRHSAEAAKEHLDNVLSNIREHRHNRHEKIQESLNKLKDFVNGIASGAISANKEVIRRVVEGLKEHKGLLGDAFGDLLSKVRGAAKSDDSNDDDSNDEATTEQASSDDNVVLAFVDEEAIDRVREVANKIKEELAEKASEIGDKIMDGINKVAHLFDPNVIMVADGDSPLDRIHEVAEKVREGLHHVGDDIKSKFEEAVSKIHDIFHPNGDNLVLLLGDHESILDRLHQAGEKIREDIEALRERARERIEGLVGGITGHNTNLSLFEGGLLERIAEDLKDKADHVREGIEKIASGIQDVVHRAGERIIGDGVQAAQHVKDIVG